MIIQRFNLNLIPNQSPVVVHVNQYDTGTGRLVATLYEGNEPYSPNGTAVIQGTKPDGHGFQYTATLDGNVVTADLTEQMAPVAGDVRVQIVVTESSGVTGTFAFIIRVQPSALPSDADMSESDYPLIEEAIREAQEAVERAEAAISETQENAEDSEAWAQGTRGGIPVDPTDQTYEHNAEYWAQYAKRHAEAGISVCITQNLTKAQWDSHNIGDEDTWLDTATERRGTRINDIFIVTGTATDSLDAYFLIYRSTTASGDLKGILLSKSIAYSGDQGYGITASWRIYDTQANFTTYSTVGHHEQWLASQSVRGTTRIGDIFFVLGVTSDTGRAYIVVYRSTTASGDLEGDCIGSVYSDRGMQGERGDQGLPGEDGAPGNGIGAIIKTGTSGLVDTYTIFMTNGDTPTFTVTNGEKGDAATIAAGTVTMLPAGSTPTVTNSGTPSDAVFDFELPSIDGGVSSFNGRSGSILPMAGDYDSEKILLASVLHIGGETQDNVQKALEALEGNKADKVDNAVEDNFAGLDADGNLKDSGKKASDFATPSNIDDIKSYLGILATPVPSYVANTLPVLKRNITSAFYNGSLRGEIAAGNFKNVRPGDYIIGQATGSTYYVAMCDYRLGKGDQTNNANFPAYGTHHLGLMLFKPVGTTALWRGYGHSNKSWRVSAADLGRCPWNAALDADPANTEAVGADNTNITRTYGSANVSGYMGSFIRERIDAILLPQCFQADFGSANVLKYREINGNAVATDKPSGGQGNWNGCTSGWGWYDRYLDLPSEVELYGSRIFGSGMDAGCQCEQLPLFRNAAIHDFYPRIDIWTKAVASSSGACRRDGYGYATSANASSAYWACPLACVK